MEIELEILVNFKNCARKKMQFFNREILATKMSITPKIMMNTNQL